MKLKQIIETVPDTVILEVQKHDGEVIFIGKAGKCFSAMSDIYLEENVFTFFPLMNVDGDIFLDVYLDN